MFSSPAGISVAKASGGNEDSAMESDSAIAAHFLNIALLNVQILLS